MTPDTPRRWRRDRWDEPWGCQDRARGYTGANLLGRALMLVRDELRARA